jgi:3-methylcrotonyl-CoA carboxylase alpha subunit
VEAILEAAAASGATAVHPGYGFLSENAGFAAAVEAARLAWVGPPSAAIAALGDKAAAKATMVAAGVPVVPGWHGADASDAALTAAAAEIGYPVLVKAVAGGGGKGMKVAATPADLPAAVASARREAAAAFSDDRLLVERLVLDPRHIEVQVLADAHGGAVHLNERDCSVQRRHQKVLEEAPAPGLDGATRAALGASAVAAARAVGYCGAGTVEFLVDGNTGEAFFLEVNARLQVEHPVTEGVTLVKRGGAGSRPRPLDLVEEQLRAAAGERLGFTQADVSLGGAAIEARLYAERPEAGFLPAAGSVAAWRAPRGATAFGWGWERGNHQRSSTSTSLRLDAAVTGPGDAVGTFYDPMVGKLLARGPDRPAALAALRAALADLRLGGLPTNVGLCWRIAGHPAFVRSGTDGHPAIGTGFLTEHGADVVRPPPPPAATVAVAALARHLLGEKSGGGPGVAPWGAWASSSSARPVSGLPARRTVRLALPAAGCAADLVLTFEGCGGDGGGGESASVRVTGEVSSPEADTSSSSGPAPPPPTPVDVTLTAPVLTPPSAAKNDGLWTLTARVGGRRVSAELAAASDGDDLCLHVWGADPGEGGGGTEFRAGLARRWPRSAVGGGESGGGSAASASAAASAPMHGRVVRLLVGPGDAVTRGQPVAVLEAMKMEHAVVAPMDGRVASVGVAVGALVASGEELVWVESDSGGGGEG